MASTNATTTSPILNPNVYLNYLPHKTAVEFEVARNVYLATAGVRLFLFFLQCLAKDADPGLL